MTPSRLFTETIMVWLLIQFILPRIDRQVSVYHFMQETLYVLSDAMSVAYVTDLFQAHVHGNADSTTESVCEMFRLGEHTGS